MAWAPPDMHLVATVLQNLGNLHLDQGAVERAAARYGEGLSRFLELQDRLGAARCLEGIAEITGTRGEAARAARLCGAATALRSAIGVPRPPGGSGTFERITAALRAELGETDFTAMWAAGEALSLAEETADARA